MARPVKFGLDYFSVDVNNFSKLEIRKRSVSITEMELQYILQYYAIFFKTDIILR